MSKRDDKIVKTAKGVAFNLFLADLVSKGISLNKPKTEILRYIFLNDKAQSINKMSKDLKIDYKNLWRYLKQFEKDKIVKLTPNKKSQGKAIKVMIPKNYQMFENIDVGKAKKYLETLPLIDGRYRVEIIED